MIRRSFFLLLACSFLALPVRQSFASASIADKKDLIVQDLSGKTVDIASYTAQSKKPLLLFFWTSWCPYCLKELKDLNQKQEELGGKVDLFAINAGESKKTVERVVSDRKLTARVFTDEEMKAADGFDVLGVPTFVLIDEKGSVLFKDNFFPEAEIKKITGK